MGNIVDQVSGAEDAPPVRCPVCGVSNLPGSLCRHVRWTFDQGDPIDFARYALETSPYVRNRGGRPSDIPGIWWKQHGEWVIEQVLLHFEADGCYVFGEVGDLDWLTRDIWKEFRPEPAPHPIPRT